MGKAQKFSDRTKIATGRSTSHAFFPVSLIPVVAFRKISTDTFQNYSADRSDRIRGSHVQIGPLLPGTVALNGCEANLTIAPTPDSGQRLCQKQSYLHTAP